MITKLIFDWATRTPDKTAVIYNGRPWSYRSFAQLIAVARGYFARRGYVGPGYALLAVRHLLDFWVLSLALRSLGLTTASVPSAAALREHWLGLPNVRGVITSLNESWPCLADVARESGLPLLSVSLEGEQELGLDAFESPHPPGGHILATSGTTGSYKRVLVNAAVDAEYTRREVEVLGLNQESVYCVFNYPAWTAIGYGRAVNLWFVGGAVLIDQGRELYHALSHPGITHGVLVPSMFAGIVAAPADAFPRNDTMQLIVGGAVITQTQIDQLKARITERVFNWFGSTEVDVVAFTPLDTPEDRKWHRLVPSRVVEIVDESDRPVPTGRIGRLRVSTAGGPTEYFHDETATRSFFKDGFFYPGDLVVMRSDGRMALQGRVTDVINVQGEKFSPAPIEERLADIFSVSGVCLFSTHNDSGEEEIHVVIESSKPIDKGQLNAAIKKELPGVERAHVHYMVALPRNEVGKLSRREVRVKMVGSPPAVARMD
jgi:acyl-coenzyme A synthetase/AMP-(fatty) acid ligase